MHTLLLMRHADAEHFSGGRGDKYRALSEHGHEEAATVAAWLSEQGIRVDKVRSSSAVRARETADGVAGGAPVRGYDNLYNASAHAMLDLIRGTEESVGTLLVVAHAPGIPTLAHLLADIDSDPALTADVGSWFPTATVARFTVDGTWADLSEARLTDVHRIGR